MAKSFHNIFCYCCSSLRLYMCATSPKKLCVYARVHRCTEEISWKKLSVLEYIFLVSRIHSQNDSLNFAHTRNVLCLCTCCMWRLYYGVKKICIRKEKNPAASLWCHLTCVMKFWLSKLLMGILSQLSSPIYFNCH